MSSPTTSGSHNPPSDAPFDAKFTDGTGAGIRFVLSDHADSVVVKISLGMTPVRTLRGTNFLAGDTRAGLGRQERTAEWPSGRETIR